MDSPNLPDLESTIARAWPAHGWSGYTVLVGVSGGADSVALAHVLNTLYQGELDTPQSEVAARPAVAAHRRLVVAHLNHGLRGDDADADEALVRQLAQTLGLAITCEKTTPPKSTAGLGLEGWLRRARYQFFIRAARAHGARYVATAHTRDDQLETLLMRISRGTGIQGLRGIRPNRRLAADLTAVRPMLAASRRQVLDHLQQHGLPHRQDAMNADARFVRARVRHQLLPQLRQWFGDHVDQALLRLAAHADEVYQVLAQQAGELESRAVIDRDPRQVTLRLSALQQSPPLVAKQLLRELWSRQRWPQRQMSGAKWELLLDSLLSPTVVKTAHGAEHRSTLVMFPGGIALRRQGTTAQLLGPQLSQPSE